ncbi:hypothetical protein C8Q75DRAFT_115451 [Abortiporus biennis]|nr:hypothetical protein C8Q75DRAFT_115451 [Abortiporus biennis]
MNNTVSLSGQSKIVELPTEILHRIFKGLNYKELKQASQVCRHFHDIVSGSPMLQFKFELAALGLVEGPSAENYDLRFKQDLLKRYQNVWDSPSSKTFKSHTIPPDPIAEYESLDLAQYCENVIAMGIAGSQDIEMILLESPLHRIQEKRWKIHVEKPINNFCICPSQDLLVVTSIVSNSIGRSIYAVDHLRMSTGERHQDSLQIPFNPIPYDVNLEIPRAYTASYGSHVGMLIPKVCVTGKHMSSKFLLWNWRTGDLLLNIETTQPQLYRYTFPDESHVILTGSWGAQREGSRGDSAALFLVDIWKGETAFAEAIQFQLPSLSSGVMVDDIGIFEASAPPNISKVTPVAIFEADKQSSMIAVEVEVISFPIPAEDGTLPFDEFQTFFRTSKILELGEIFTTQQRLTIPWDMWGPMNTRVTTLSTGFWSLFGARVVASDEVHFSFMDFNMQPSTGEKETAWSEFRDISSIPTDSDECDFFKDEVTSSLPYRSISTDIQDEDLPIIHSVILSDDNILIFDWYNSRRPATILTMQF